MYAAYDTLPAELKRSAAEAPERIVVGEPLDLELKQIAQVLEPIRVDLLFYIESAGDLIGTDRRARGYALAREHGDNRAVVGLNRLEADRRGRESPSRRTHSAHLEQRADVGGHAPQRIEAGEDTDPIVERAGG